MSVSEKVARKGWKTQTSLQETLPVFSLDIAARELGETDDIRTEALKKLRDILKADGATRAIAFEEDLLVQFLRHAKYHVNQAHRHLRNFVVMRGRHEYMFRGVVDDLFLTAASTKYIYLLPWRCPKGCAVVVCEPGKWDPSEMSLDDFKRLILMVFEQSLRDPMTQVHGYKVIFNFKGTALRHLRYCTPPNIHLFYHIALSCIPGRYKEVYIVYQSAIFRLLWQILKNLLSEKIKGRIEFPERPEDMRKYIPPEILPPQYGGALKYEPTEWLRRINKDHAMFGPGGQKNYY